MAMQLSKRKLCCTGIVLLLGQLGIGQQQLHAEQDPQPLPIVKGAYRLPFSDGTEVLMSNNYTNHPANLNKIDMVGGGSPTTIVAAAAGWIRMITENNDTFCPNACGFNNDCSVPADGTTDNQAAQTQACGNYNGTTTFCCERHIEANGGTCPNGGTCRANPDTCTNNAPNNFVWMEHPNGEWSTYLHMMRGSTGQGIDNLGNPGAGRFVGEFVGAGTPLGIEGDVGYASGPHLHFEVGVPNYVELTGDLETDNLIEADPDLQPAGEDDWFCRGNLRSDGIQDDVVFEDPDLDDENNPDDDVNRQNRIAIFCQVGFPIDGDTRTAGPCDDTCGANPNDLIVQGTYTSTNTPFYDQSADTVGNDSNDLIIKPYAGVSIRAANSVTLTPGFHAELNSFFAASLGSCDSPGGTGD